MTNRLSFTEFSAAVSGGTLVLSVLYEWAYFKVAGFELMSLMTISDLFRLALVWLPASFLILLGLVMYQFLTQGIEKGLSKQEIAVGPAIPRVFSSFRRSATVFFIWIVGLGAFVNAVFSQEPSFGAIGICAVIFWGYVSNKITDVPRIREQYGATGCAIIVMAPIVVIMCVAYGAGTAQSDLSEEATEYNVDLVEGKSLSRVNILRSLEKGILIKTSMDSSLLFLPWPEVSSVNALTHEAEDKRSLACQISSSFCRKSDNQNKIFDEKARFPELTDD